MEPSASVVDVDDDFAPHYMVIPAKAKVVKELRSAAKGIRDIYLAADPDREGEAICQHLSEELSGKSRTIHRVLFHEITKNAIQEAFQKPGRINKNQVDAQLARRILDRLVGYKISPLLWDKVRRGLSAGRVQTVALRMIVEREQEIRGFESEEMDLRPSGRGIPSRIQGLGQVSGREKMGCQRWRDRQRNRRGIEAGFFRCAGDSSKGEEKVSRPALHHKQAAAGRSQEAGILRQKDDGAGPEAL
jgi:hypothetical protein